MRRIRFLLIVVGSLLLGLSIFFIGCNAYVVWRASRQPADRLILKTPEGVLIPIPPPVTNLPPPPSLDNPEDHEDYPEEDSRPEVFMGPFLPATRFAIPKLGLNVRATVGDETVLPRAKAVAWYYGTAFPGAPGNSVMYGHVAGPFETLGRLGELVEGDDIEVYTEQRVWTYKVTESKVVLPTEVTIMAPTPDPTLTVFTCAGDQNPVTRLYSHRLAVTAKLAGSATLSR
ncbi:MAG: sortase [Chloroflexota bacterium]|nr:MAG: sortase [Chloroflexota bacterium]